jgi:pseudaminic acid synthase
MLPIDINGRLIGPGHPPFIIAEMSGNHNGSLSRAREIVHAAAEAGADAIKLQTYTADTMTIRSDKPDFFIGDPKSPWHGKTLYDLYQEAHTPWEWHEELFALGRKLGLIVFSTPFDTTALKFLTQLQAPLFKIASFENTDLPLIRSVAATGKPMIISAGTATMEEIGQALSTARAAGASQLVLLKCTSSYPAPHSEANVRSIPFLADKFNVPVGLSDHTLGIGTSVAAVTLGAVAIEKHVTLSRAEGGVDSGFSLEPHELAALVKESRHAWESLGSGGYATTASEESSRIYRRSLYVVKPIRKGESFTPENIRVIRPGYGLPPVRYDAVVGGCKATSDLEPGTALAEKHITHT